MSPGRTIAPGKADGLRLVQEDRCADHSDACKGPRNSSSAFSTMAVPSQLRNFSRPFGEQQRRHAGAGHLGPEQGQAAGPVSGSREFGRNRRISTMVSSTCAIRHRPAVTKGRPQRMDQPAFDAITRHRRGWLLRGCRIHKPCASGESWRARDGRVRGTDPALFAYRSTGERRDPPSWKPGTDAASTADVVFVQFSDACIRDATGVWLKAYVVEGIEYIMSFADPAVTKDVVVNLSYGPTTGPHDGTHELEEALTELVTKFDGTQGKPKLEIVLPRKRLFQRRTRRVQRPTAQDPITSNGPGAFLPTIPCYALPRYGWKRLPTGMHSHPYAAQRIACL